MEVWESPACQLLMRSWQSVAREELATATERGTGLKSSPSSVRFVRRSTDAPVVMIVHVCAADPPVVDISWPGQEASFVSGGTFNKAGDEPPLIRATDALCHV